MLDKRCFALLDIINARCQVSGYKIFDINELVSAMPKYFRADESVVKDCIVALFEAGYLNVKYQDDNEVCLCPLPKGRMVFEDKISQFIESNHLQKKVFVNAFLGSLLGGALGGILVSIALRLFGGAN